MIASVSVCLYAHQVQANVGYYTSLVGLGSSTKDTAIAKLNCDNGDWNYEGGALANFWRSAENFVTSGDIDWAVSQGTNQNLSF